MSKEQEFIEAIQKALSDFEQLEKSISEKNSKDILHIRGLLEGNEPFIELHALIKDYVEMQMYRKLSWFLPFIVDLKTQLLDVLKMSKFNPVSWLHSTRLKRSRSVGDMSSDDNFNIKLKEMSHSEHSGCEARFSTLESEIRKIKEINENYKIKNDQHEEVLKKISVNYSQIHAELIEVKKSLQLAKTENEKLNFAILQKDQEISELKSENAMLKSGKSQSKQTSPIHEPSNPNARKSSFGIFS